MKYNFKPTGALEIFASKVYNLLVENFPQTYYVGGMVRDLLLNRKVTDVDIATSATPEQVMEILNNNKINYSENGKSFGVIAAKQNSVQIEIATFRTEHYSTSRYPRIQYIQSPKQDSQRRDFTINSLYLSAQTGKILDFYKGLADIKNKKIKFIGHPEIKIKQDPLRIIRALRFALVLNFKLENKTKVAVKNNFHRLKFLTAPKISSELSKVASLENKKILQEVINNPKTLDKYFK